MQLNGSQIFVEVLCEQGVDTIFGYPGGAVLNLYDELFCLSELSDDELFCSSELVLSEVSDEVS